MNKAEVYYFSGTGNSLHVARELQKRIPEVKLIPIVSLLDKDIIKTDSETVGFIFPVHLATIPIPVKEFLKKVDLKTATYIFALATRCGTTHRAFLDTDKALKKQGKSLSSYFNINMSDNNPRFQNWHIPTEEEVEKIESEAKATLELIQETIVNQEKKRGEDTTAINTLPTILIWGVPLLTGLADLLGFHDDFYSESKCSGCGTCEKVCLAKKIQMINNRPIWQKNITCFSCRACLNYCPVQAVQMKKSHTDKNGRYYHPFATANEIAGQK